MLDGNRLSRKCFPGQLIAARDELALAPGPVVPLVHFLHLSFPLFVAVLAVVQITVLVKYDA